MPGNVGKDPVHTVLETTDHGIVLHMLNTSNLNKADYIFLDFKRNPCKYSICNKRFVFPF